MMDIAVPACLHFSEGHTKRALEEMKDLSDLPALRDIKKLKEAEPVILPNLDADAS